MVKGKNSAPRRSTRQSANQSQTISDRSKSRSPKVAKASASGKVTATSSREKRRAVEKASTSSGKVTKKAASHAVKAKAKPSKGQSLKAATAKKSPRVAKKNASASQSKSQLVQEMADDEEDEEPSDEGQEEEEDEEALRSSQRRVHADTADQIETRRKSYHPPAVLVPTIDKLRQDRRFKRMGDENLVRLITEYERNPETPSYIAVTSASKPQRHRTRVRWTPAEENDLRRGVAIHGDCWTDILNDSSLTFQDRTQVDLKDKWRNLVKYRAYGEHPFRRYMLVDANHEPIYTAGANHHIFRNRWPIEAATKAATKDFVYQPGQDTAEIYLREMKDDSDMEGAAEVHVFEVTHRVEPAADIPKFEKYRTVKVGRAKKIRTERYLTREAVEAILKAPKSKA